MTPYARRVAIAFVAGGIIALVGMILPPMMIGVLGNFIPFIRPVLPLSTILGPLIGFFLSGAIGGASLRMGTKVVIGFGIGFLVAGLIVPLTLVSIQAMSGKENPFGVLLFFTLTFGLGFALAGAIGATFMGQGFRVIRTSAAGFGVGGTIGGSTAVLPFLIMGGEANYGGLGQLGFLMLLAGILVGVLVPYFIGGAVLGKAAEKAVTQPK